jgi:hypothetical protein
MQTSLFIRRRTILIDHVSSTPVSALFPSFVWRGATNWSQVPAALVRFVDRSFCNRGVSVEFFTVKTFRMDGRLKASRSLTSLPDRRASWGPRIAGEENNGLVGAFSKTFQAIQKWLRGQICVPTRAPGLVR